VHNGFGWRKHSACHDAANHQHMIAGIEPGRHATFQICVGCTQNWWSFPLTANGQTVERRFVWRKALSKMSNERLAAFGY
jgi:hypothetical protein